MADNSKDFATVGTESFNLKAKDESAKEGVVINIEDDKPEGIVLERVESKDEKIGLFKRINRYLSSHAEIKVDVKANFFHLLSVMINAGISMVRALKSLSEQMKDNPRMEQIVIQLSEYIEGGESLSEAMVNYPDVFTEQEVGMIQSGEASGQLAKVLDSIANEGQKKYMIRKKVKSAMMYPMIIFTLLILVMIAMMIWVIPNLKDIFDQQGADLPLVTRIVVGISNFMVNHKIALLLMFLVVLVGIVAFKKSRFGIYMIDKLKIKLPIFGILFKKSYLAQFSRSFSNLLDSSVSFVRTLEISANSVGNEVYKRRLLLAVEDIKQGIPLAENLTEESELFPPMMVNMIDVGEKTAQLNTITAKLADYYEDEVDTAVKGIAKLIEPIILVVIGGAVGVIVLAIMLPIIKISDLASSI